MALELELNTILDVPLEAEHICPDIFCKTDSNTEIAKLPVFYGNNKQMLGDFFTIKGSFDGHIVVSGALDKVKYIGANMSFGQISIHGDVGMHTGATMKGGEIHIQGHASDWLGAEMQGGRIIVEKDAGHMVGSAYRGERIGMRGGEIIIYGNVKNELGHAMRNGLILIVGNSGDFTGVNMNAGTIIILGEIGIRTGAEMKRGSIICKHTPMLLPTFAMSCTYSPTFLRYYYNHLNRLNLKCSLEFLRGQFERWSGDSIALNRGEILLHKND